MVYTIDFKNFNNITNEEKILYIIDCKNLKKFKDFVIDNYYKMCEFIDIINIDLNQKNLSVLFKNRVIILCKMMQNFIKENKEEIRNRYINYWNSTSVKDKIRLREGDEALKNSMIYWSKINKKRTNTGFTCERWLKRGYSPYESAIKQYNCVLENTQKRRKRRYKNKSYVNSLNYWLSQGYYIEDSKKLKSENISPNNIDGFIKRHGIEEGTKRFKKYSEYRTKKFYEMIKNGKINCCVSNVSVKFFIKIYKKIRKLGFNKNDIYWGIKGSREWWIRKNDKEYYFYDFTIKSINVIIEYNDIFWHAREDLRNQWKQTSNKLSFDETLKKEIDKKEKAIKAGFKYFVVWNDNLPNDLDYFIEYILK